MFAAIPGVCVWVYWCIVVLCAFFIVYCAFLLLSMCILGSMSPTTESPTRRQLLKISIRVQTLRFSLCSWNVKLLLCLIRKQIRSRWMTGWHIKRKKNQYYFDTILLHSAFIHGCCFVISPHTAHIHHICFVFFLPWVNVQFVARSCFERSLT